MAIRISVKEIARLFDNVGSDYPSGVITRFNPAKMDYEFNDKPIVEIDKLGKDGRFRAPYGEESIDSGAPEFEWVDPFSMLISVMDQVSGDPADIGFFGPFSDMERASDSAHLIDQLRLHDCDKRF